MSYEQIAEQVLDISVTKIVNYITPAIKEYEISKESSGHNWWRWWRISFIPKVAKKMGFQYKKAEYADVISSIGVATGMIYEEKERTNQQSIPKRCFPINK